MHLNRAFQKTYILVLNVAKLRLPLQAPHQVLWTMTIIGSPLSNHRQKQVRHSLQRTCNVDYKTLDGDVNNHVCYHVHERWQVAYYLTCDGNLLNCCYEEKGDKGQTQDETGVHLQRLFERWMMQSEEKSNSSSSVTIVLLSDSHLASASFFPSSRVLQLMLSPKPVVEYTCWTKVAWYPVSESGVCQYWQNNGWV